MYSSEVMPGRRTGSGKYIAESPNRAAKDSTLRYYKDDPLCPSKYSIYLWLQVSFEQLQFFGEVAICIKWITDT